MSSKDYSLTPPAPVRIKYRSRLQRVAFVSDIHIPYHHPHNLKIAMDILSDWKPDLVYLGGDILDNYMISDYTRDPDRQATLQDEIDTMQDVLVRPLNSITKNVIYQLGNHEERLFRHIRQSPALFQLRSLSISKAAGLPKTWTIYQDQTHLSIGGLIFHHGNVAGKGSAGKHAASGMLAKLRTSNISGHHHRFSYATETDYYGKIQVSLCNGHLSDTTKARYITCPNWQAGITLLEYGNNNFQAYQVLINNGAVFNGKTYK